jgi:L-histidine Nalpha-methyltransferase
MKTHKAGSILVNPGTDPRRLHDEVLSALSDTPRTLPSQLLFDERGSMLFDCLCTLPEFYPVRAEMEILERHGGEITALLGLDRSLIAKKLGNGQKTKATKFLDRREEGDAPLMEYLWRSSGRSEVATHQRLRIISDPPRSPTGTKTGRRIIYLPWSLVGNLSPAEIEHTLAEAEELCGGNGGILLGLDLTQDVRALGNAFNDRLGIAAAFNLNVLERLNREFDGDFNLRWFQHRAFYDSKHGRTEMQLVSLRDQEVYIDGLSIFLREYETIQTAHYYQHTLPDFARLAEASGLRVEHVWMDERECFSVHYVRPIF